MLVVFGKGSLGELLGLGDVWRLGSPCWQLEPPTKLALPCHVMPSTTQQGSTEPSEDELSSPEL